MSRLVKIIFFALIVKPIVLIVLGLNIRGHNKLPKTGPAVIVANHNSHLDTMVLMSLYPLSMLHKIRPVAAADYFMQKGGLLAWFSLNCIGIIPLDRSSVKNKTELFDACHASLDQGDILIIYPEGSRGKPEEISNIKKGVFYLTNDRIDTTITPVMMHGLGRALPKGTALLVPFNCDVVIGDTINAEQDKVDQFTQAISDSFDKLAGLCLTKTSGD